MAGDSTTFEVNVAANAIGVDAAASAVSSLEKNLSAAGLAATAAADAVKAGQVAYNQAETAANKAASALEKIGLAADAQRGKLAKAVEVGDTGGIARATAKLAELTARQGEAATKAASTAAAMNAEAAALDKLKNAAVGATTAQANISKALEKAKTTAAAATKAQTAAAGSGKVNEIGEGLGKLGGPLGSVGQKLFGAAEGFKKLSGSLGSAGPYAAIAVGIVAIAAGVAAVTVAAAAGVFAITKWAVGLADAARSQALLTQGVAKSVEGGKELARAVDDISERVPLATADIQALAPPLIAAGLKGNALADALEAAAEKAALTKLGPDFVKELNSLPSLATRIQKNFARIFGGLNIEGVLGALRSMVSLFDRNTESATAIKVVFESLFQPLLDGITAWVPKMISAFIQFEILVLKALIAIKPFGSTILTVAKVLGVVAAVVVGALAVAIGVVIAGVAAMAVGFSFAIVVVTALVAGVIWLGLQFASLGSTIFGALKSAWDFLSGLSLTGIGTALIDGLIAGIKAAAGGILTAMTGAVGAAIDGAKSLLGIASPSKVFAEIGMQTGAGMAQGVDRSADDAQGSLEALVAPPAAAGGGGAAGGRGGSSVVIENLNVTAPAGADARGFALELRDALADLLTMSTGGPLNAPG